MKIFSTMQSKIMLVCAALAFAGAASSQTMQVNGAACANATVTIAQGIVNLTVPQACGGSTAVAPIITAYAPPNGTAGVAYTSYNFVASGSPNPTWSATGLPSGLTLSSGGVLTGTPSTAGASSVTVTATNTAGTDSKTITLTIDAPTGPPVIAASTVPAGTINQAYSFTFTASGAQPITWATANGSNLPPGVTLTQPNGTNSYVLSGTPSQSGSFAFGVTATNSVSSVTSLYTLQIAAAASLSITAQTPTATATVGTAYPAYTFQANPSTNLTWSVNGALPAGLSLSPSTGVLSGTPTTAGAATFTVSVTNGTSTTTSNSITITVSAAANCTSDTSIDDGCIPSPSKTPNVIPLRTNGKLAGADVNAYAVETATSCAASNAQVGAGAQVTRRWQHNLDFLSYKQQTPVDNIGMVPGEALSYRFTTWATAPAGFPSTGQMQWDIGSSYTPVATFMTISTSPCDFDVTKLSPPRNYCYVSTSTTGNAVNYDVTSGNGTLGYCVLRPNTTYYLNIRFLSAQPSVGNLNVDSCAASGAGKCGGIIQIR